ncbi:hypothetical protein [Rhizosaccharibacter radicis]|uniref:DUF4239 domain-containing protein n=1 Tax=Rhizosaccharibacter radicis TaxID=2782605 RepID=A0ABT1VVW0_9PROT|nr:DUF4239 domain-containing protein [Acetobacteraceae bacterium KSS12]
MYIAQALLTLGLCFVLAASVSLMVSRRIDVSARRRHHEVGIAVFLQIGVIYAVLLAFVFSEVWDQFNDAAKVVDTECASVLGIAERADNVPEPSRSRLRDELSTYLTLEIDDEWPRMQKRSFSRAVSGQFSRIYDEIASVDPANARIAAARDRMLTLAGRIHEARAERLFQLRSNVPPFLWGLLIVDALMLVGFVLFSGMEHHAVQLGVVAVFATFLCGILLTIHLLDFPYEGTISIDDQPLVETLEQLGTMRHQPSP